MKKMDEMKKRILGNFNNLKLGYKMGICFLVGVMIPILFIQLVSYHLNQNYMSEKINELTVNNLKQVAERTDLTIEIYTNLLYQIYIDDDITTKLNDYMDGNKSEKAGAYNAIHNRLMQYNVAGKGIRCVSIVCSNGDSIICDYETGSALDNLWSNTTDMRKIAPYTNAINETGMVLSPTEEFDENGKNRYIFHVSKRIYDFKKLEKGSRATVIMSIDASVLNKICKTKDSYSYTYIMDQKRRIISFPRDMFLGITVSRKVDEEYLIKISNLLKGNPVVFNTYKDEKTGWVFYSVYDKDYMLREIKQTQFVFLAIGALAILFAVLLILYTVYHISKSVVKVVKGMKQAEEGNLDVIVPVEGKDEIGQIAEAFNKMISKIKELICQVRVATDKQKNAEIKALEAQINPHFLYNTLDSINWMAIEKGEYEISNMLRNLGVILRYSINKSNEMARIDEVADWLDKYISLQQMRFHQAFTYEIHIEEGAKQYRIYKLLLQPFIENSILHGFEGMEEGGQLTVTILLEKEENMICIMLEDNGAGMSEEVLQSVKEFDGEEDNSAHVGLQNTFARLQMYYGEKAKWHIKSMIGMGTIITIKVPIE
ncbi:two-component sensor histidine kinase [Lachnospiraceae bacterium KM106-2]|nr:two-component sensor histidine kinase [Lachnospiraceae bacterium KM106-2]